MSRVDAVEDETRTAVAKLQVVVVVVIGERNAYIFNTV